MELENHSRCSQALIGAAIFTAFFPTAQADEDSTIEKGFLAIAAEEHSTALEQLLPLAEKHNSKAQFLLSVIYQSGKGVKQDEYKAFEWCERAAKQGYPEAQFQLGLMYFNGIGVTVDDDQALEWISRAADKEHPRAKTMLDYMLNTDFSDDC